MPFGVELPENLGSESTNTQAEETSTAPETVSRAGESETTKTQEVLDLDKLERFRFDGKEWSPKDLRNSYLRHEDYTRKTQELSEARKYAENFEIDLEALKRNPELFDKFRGIYPKFYVDLAEKFLGKQPESNSQSQTAPNQAVNRDPVIEEIKSEFSEWRKAQQQAEVQKIESWLDNQFDTLGKKYSDANSEVVQARAQILADRGDKITKETLERLFKANHDEISKSWEQKYKAKVNKQLEANSRGKDTGTGGGVAGDAPKGFKTFKEATAAFLKDVGSN